MQKFYLKLAIIKFIPNISEINYINHTILNKLNIISLRLINPVIFFLYIWQIIKFDNKHQYGGSNYKQECDLATNLIIFILDDTDHNQLPNVLYYTKNSQ